jgi:hypothetical protein
MRQSHLSLSIGLVAVFLLGCSASSDSTPGVTNTTKFNGKISGTVRTYIRDTLLAGVSVRAVDTTASGNSISALTASSGKYVISAITGNYVVVVSKAEFLPETSSTILLPDDSVVKDFRLRHSFSGQTGLLEVLLKNKQTSIPIAGSTVRAPNNITAQSDANGSAVLLLPVGNQRIDITSAEYEDDSIDIVMPSKDTIITKYLLERPKPIAEYLFSRNLADSSGHKHNAAGRDAYGRGAGTSFTTDRFGVANAALLCDGHTVIAIPDDPDFRFEKNFSFTFTGWVRPANDQRKSGWAGSTYVLSKKDDTQNGVDVTLRYCEVARPCGMSAAMESSDNIGWPLEINASSQITQDQWSFFALRVSRYGPVELYINDSLAARNTDPYTAASARGKFNASLFLAGEWTYGTGNDTFWYMGALDDVRIYKSFLSPKDISTIYHERGW